MTVAQSLPGIVRKFGPPVMAVGGLLIVAFSQVSWGASDQGVRPTISGLGRVSVPGAGPGDVAFLEDHTLRPGLVTVILGAVITVVAVLGWMLIRWRVAASALAGLAALAALVTAAVVVADPTAHLFDDRVNDVLGGDPTVLSPGYGLIGVMIVSALVTVLVAVTVIVDLRGRAETPGDPVTTPGDESS